MALLEPTAVSYNIECEPDDFVLVDNSVTDWTHYFGLDEGTSCVSGRTGKLHAIKEDTRRDVP